MSENVPNAEDAAEESAELPKVESREDLMRIIQALVFASPDIVTLKKLREILGLSPCGADCAACGFYRAQCPGCNESCGQVFHQAEGEACPLYRCPVQKHRQASCAFCPSLPCDLWRATRDPRMTEEEFEQSIGERIARLRGFP